ncbi:MAG: DUF1501 domain-containing protein, partial [Pseudorhodobacter sp.]|nr:DUF1501 domain-containing protein [Pseudorhodobacter sp.]
LLSAVNAADPLFAKPFAESQVLVTDSMDAAPAKKNNSFRDLGHYVAEQLTAKSRIASLSLSGWDSHRIQPKIMAEQLAALSDMVLAMKEGLAAHWGTTLVIAMTEFGRTARENGTMGTDHGTGGLMIAAGGALRGKRVIADWPGLSQPNLLADRDLMPTRDVRAFAGWALHSLYGVEASAIEAVVFPGLDLGDDPALLL